MDHKNLVVYAAFESFVVVVTRKAVNKKSIHFNLLLYKVNILLVNLRRINCNLQ